MIATAINSRSQRAMAGEEAQGYTMVDSTELGEIILQQIKKQKII